MKALYSIVLAGGAGFAGVAAALWLLESAVPLTVDVPFEASRLVLMVGLLGIGWTLGRLGYVLAGASFLAGAAAMWAFHEARPLALCQSDLLYRPCTGSEMAAMVAPAIVMAALAAGVLLIRTTRRARPPRDIGRR
jgi:hypothetical protein